jgi:hypothetical protein
MFFMPFLHRCGGPSTSLAIAIDTRTTLVDGSARAPYVQQSDTNVVIGIPERTFATDRFPAQLFRSKRFD